MRTSDPAAYDALSSLTSGVAFNNQFRGLMYVSEDDSAVSAIISYNTVDNSGNYTVVTKNISFRNSQLGGTLILPISGDAITATFGGGTLYALI
jgi:hypothetical protein